MEALKFTKDHFWVRVEGRHARIGLSEQGQTELGEIQAVELPDVGETLEQGESFGEVESRKTLADLVAPVTGTVIAINTDLDDSPSLVNDDPHDEGWLVEVDLARPSELEDLMDSDEYDELVAERD